MATKAFLNAKINEVKWEIPSITNLATTAALTAVKNKIPDISNLVKNTNCNYYFRIQYGTGRKCSTKISQANLATKSDILNFVNKRNFNEKLKNLNKNINLNKTKRFTS